MQDAPSPRDIAALVPMADLLASLGFPVNTRTRRAPCLLHKGSNASAFSWTDAGLWRCHSCGQGGDRITLIRAVRGCSFREAMEILAGMAGVPWRGREVSRTAIELAKRQEERRKSQAWRLYDEVRRLKNYYCSTLRRVERLQHAIGADVGDEATWGLLARLAPAATFFYAAWQFTSTASPAEMARLALATSAERRRTILEGVPDGCRAAA